MTGEDGGLGMGVALEDEALPVDLCVELGVLPLIAYL